MNHFGLKHFLFVVLMALFEHRIEASPPSASGASSSYSYQNDHHHNHPQQQHHPVKSPYYSTKSSKIPVPPPPVKSYHQQQPITQQSYEPQSYDIQQPVPVIQHDVVGQPEPYNFNYDVKDDYGNNQFRREEQDTSGTVRGSYGYTDANGVYRIMDYVADNDGFHASIRTNEPGLSEPNSKTGEVENPAAVKLYAEQPPAQVVPQQQQYSTKSYHSKSETSSSYSSSSSSSSNGYKTPKSYQSHSKPYIEQHKIRNYGKKY